MSTKIKSIRLSYPHLDSKITQVKARLDAPRVYRVEQITDSIAINPGDMLPRKVVNDLCDSSGWKVTVVPAP